ncbi:hypothetical protein [Salicibibacter kimchii]|uniref:Uncharacterized protein n=1 Tax=Salicibibacter kimchii TaxID=2099786 RepID=A0A345C2J1_9BACI|nr:hypothetical protein [Salicibibacter kimchii]AXF57422.1 hypothetical protein DT065_16475 [Salicibibacter kimchii]
MYFDTWYEKNKWDLFWKKQLLKAGIQPGEWLRENMFFKKIERLRRECEASDDPDFAIRKAPKFDKQYFLYKWWDYLSFKQKIYYLKLVWMNSGDGNLYGYDFWLPFFEEVGFLNTKTTTQPEEMVKLYRAAEPAFQRGMSWSDDINLAAHYLRHNSGLLGPREVYVSLVWPDAVLAVFEGTFVSSEGLSGQKEVARGKEYVVNHHKLGSIYSLSEMGE